MKNKQEIQMDSVTNSIETFPKSQADLTEIKVAKGQDIKDAIEEEFDSSETLKDKISNKLYDITPDFLFRIKHKISDAFSNYKWKCQRYKRGYADIDVWNMESHLTDYFKKLLTQLLEEHHGYPATATEEQWIKVLSRMLFLLGEMDEETCSQKNEYQIAFDYYLMHESGFDENNTWKSKEPKDLSDKYYNREKELFDYRTKCKDEFFKLMSKWYWNLWD